MKRKNLLISIVFLVSFVGVLTIFHTKIVYSKVARPTGSGGSREEYPPPDVCNINDCGPYNPPEDVDDDEPPKPPKDLTTTSTTKKTSSTSTSSTSTTSSTTSTSSTTTTTVSPDVLEISCQNCKPNQECSCEISKGSCSSGLWILRGPLFNTPVVKNSPPKKISFTPGSAGNGSAMLLCFSPQTKLAKSNIISQRDPFTCDDKCEVGEPCNCRIANCSDGYFIGLNKSGQPLKNKIFKSVSNCQECEKEFTASNTGKVIARIFCLSPKESYNKTIEIISEQSVKNPRWTSIENSPQNNSFYSEDKVWQFNSTWTDPDGEVSNVLFVFNGEKFNLSEDELQKNGNEYYKTFDDLSPGEYNYRWKAVDDGGNTNETEIKSYKINTQDTKKNSEIKLTLNGNRGNTIISNDEDLVMGVEELNTEDETLHLYNNLSGTMKEAEENSDPIENRVTSNLTNPGYYKIIGNWSGNGNYKPDSESWFLNITD